MLPKPVVAKKINTTTKKSILVPSRIVTRQDDFEGGEETEIAAQITVPDEGGWGWVVVFSSFWSIFILDGTAFTFGSVFDDLTKDLGLPESVVGFLNSIALALYFMASPFASAFINRFGFRACMMTGSVISSFALLCTYFSASYGALCVFYGGFAGLGYCLINMTSSLIVGFYFEKLRSIALATASSGSSLGIMVMFPLNTYIVQIAGWRVLTLLQSGLFGIIFFLGMTYRPLLSLTVTKTTDDPTRTVTYLPSLAAVRGSPSRIKTNKEGLLPTATERLFSAVSNANFPTAAAVVDENISPTSTQPGPSRAAASKLTITAHTPQGGITQRQLKQVQSIMSKASIQDKQNKNLEATVQVERPIKRGCWARLCNWEEHVPQARPMYRDDAFYDGNLKKLPAYQKSMMDTSAETKTGLEYQLAVSRAVTTVDLRERRGVFTTAARRILVKMMDPKLLKKCSFMLLCLSGFITYLGYTVPYVFIQDRNRSYGLDPKHCSFFVSAIGFSNIIGKISLGALACKIDALKIFSFSCLMAGSATMLSELSHNLYYQYLYCSVFGFFIASLACLRSMVLVKLYGLDKLTNATGMMLLFQGLGSLISTPLASLLKTNFGYTFTFYAAGAFLLLSGAILNFVNPIADREMKTITA